MNIPDIAVQVQHVLAPAVMISSSALLLLGFQTKFSNLANRFRSLNDERRRLLQKEKRLVQDEARLESLVSQINYLMKRAAHIQSAILSTYFAILCFTATSLMIFIDYHIAGELWKIAYIPFLGGFLFVSNAALYIIRETRLFYKVMVLEQKS